MKSIKLFVAAGAIGLLGMAGLSSCKQNNTPEGPDGNYNGEVVKTEFMINIAENVAGRAEGTLYMPAATVQEAQNRGAFRGMDKIVLIPFDADFTTRLGKNILLNPIPTTVAAGDDKKGKLNAANNIYYEDVAIPIGTKRFLFYGKAIDDGEHTDSNENADVYISTDDAKKHQYGIVTANGLYGASLNPASISFDLVKIYGTDGIPTQAQTLADYIKAIANVDDGGSPAITWKDYVTDNTTYAPLTRGNDGIHDLYTKFINMKAGSATAILAALEDLYNTLERMNSLLVTPDPLATRIMAQILDKIHFAVPGTVGDRTLAWDDVFTASNYPASIGLPDGAAVVVWDSENDEFDPVVGDHATIGSGTGAVEFGKLTQFVYPPSLQYFAQSTIETATSSKKSYYDGVNPWSTILGQYTDNGTVQSNTKSVAIHDPIEYGVGKLDVVVKRGGTSGNATWTDNGAAAGIDPVAFTFDGGKSLNWKGLLIGGQKQVDYNFTQNEDATDVFVIYDNALNGNTDGLVTIPNNGTTVTNHTLVFSSKDNKTGDAMGSDEIYVVLEMKNTLGDFIGKDGLIPENGTFYLVGKLNSSSVDGTAMATNHPDKYNLFYKDYTTTLNITLGEDCLKKAYYTIPDLRSSNLELGFSVDLVWKTGLVFNVEI